MDPVRVSTRFKEKQTDMVWSHGQKTKRKQTNKNYQILKIEPQWNVNRIHGTLYNTDKHRGRQIWIISQMSYASEVTVTLYSWK